MPAPRTSAPSQVAGRATRLAALAYLFAACSSQNQRVALREQLPDNGTRVQRVTESATFSPQLDENPPARPNCSAFDTALGQVARRIGEAMLLRSESLDPEAIQQGLRESGSPYVWPHAFAREGHDTPKQSLEAIDAWLTSFDDGGERRCGSAAIEGPDGRKIVVAVAVDVLADLEPLPRQARVGSWIQFSARLLVRADSAKLYVLGPRGVPRSVPTTFDGNAVRARFSVDRPGRWLVQLVADVAGGPRQVLEAEILAGDLRDALAEEVPGLGTTANSNPETALELMIRSTRQSEGLPPLIRDAALDRLATEQAHALMAARRVAHDVGSGDPEARVTSAGLLLSAVGENVAHASSAERAHRALWRSPSHRSNLLSPHFDAIGIGVAEDADGSLWVCELFGRRAR